MHEHKECDHKTLKHCAKCDVVYCSSCKKEWSNKSLNVTLGGGMLNVPPTTPNTLPWKNPWENNVILCASTHN